MGPSEITRKAHDCHKKNDEHRKTPNGKNRRQSRRPHHDDVDGTLKRTGNFEERKF